VEYDVSLVSLNVVPMSIDGGVEPLCNSCMSIDCTNPIAKTQVSIFGKEKTYRLFKYGRSYKMVVDCDGYVQSTGNLIEEEEEEEEIEED